MVGKVYQDINVERPFHSRFISLLIIEFAFTLISEALIHLAISFSNIRTPKYEAKMN